MEDYYVWFYGKGGLIFYLIDIGILYLIFGVIVGVMGICFLVLICMELVEFGN